MGKYNTGKMEHSVVLSMDPDRTGHYICSGTNDEVEIQEALDELNRLGGGTLYVKLGIYSIDGDINIPSGEVYIIQGEGPYDDTQNPKTTGGVCWNFTDGARFTATYGSQTTFRDMGFAQESGDTWIDTWIDFYTVGGVNAPIDLSSFYCKYSISGINPAGSSTNPWGTPSGCVIAVGRESGPSSIPHIWMGNSFYDNRQDDGDGTNTHNTLFMCHVEGGEFKNNYWRTQLPAAMVTANLMAVDPVVEYRFEGNQIFHEVAHAGDYQHQYMCGGANKNYYMENEQLIDTAFFSGTGTHFTQNGGDLYVSGEGLYQAEGGNVPYLPTGAQTNVGEIHFRIRGRGWENWGIGTIPNLAATTGNIAHGLLGTPPLVTWGAHHAETADHPYFSTRDATNIAITVANPTTGDRTGSWYARYSFDVT